VFPIQEISYIEIDCFALAILLLIFLNIRRQAAQLLIEQKIYMALLCSDALILVLDLLMWFLDGKPGFPARDLYYIVTAGYYALNPLICMIWYFYADYQIYKSEKHIKKMLIPMLIPTCINFILSFLSIVDHHLLFYLDENNIYHRGNLFYIMAAISFFYLVYTLILILLERKGIEKQDFIPLLVFVIPPFVGGIIQAIYYGISLIWICVTLSILILFINIQNNQLYTDYLTGLFNRRQLDNYLQQKAQNIENGLLAGIMIDLNSFKEINDIYGHHIGDQALQHTAEILKKTFRKNDDFIARYGGDEFVILMVTEDITGLYNEVERLKEAVRQFNAQKIVPYAISFSIGCDCYSGETEDTASEFLKHIDDLMYQDKQRYMKSQSG
jgi:diguanylate cyclase (GGDEF)-like protein